MRFTSRLVLEIHAHEREPARRVGVQPRPERGEGLSAAERHLQRPHHPTPVGRLHARGGDRVDRHQTPVQRQGVRLHLQLGSHRRKPPRDRELVDDRPVIETGAADQQRTVTPLLDGINGRRSPLPGTRRRWLPPTGRADRAGDGAPRPAPPSVGLAVPMSISRYTCIESAETTSQVGSRRAKLKCQCRLARSCRTDERGVLHRCGHGMPATAQSSTIASATPSGSVSTSRWPPWRRRQAQPRRSASLASSA